MGDLNADYRELRLDNGLVVALQNTPTSTINGRLRVHHGGLHEREGEEGLAHFLEHTIMMAGGKKFTPKVAKEIMGTFGHINATTSSHETCFPVGMIAEDLELYLDFISDIAFNPRLDSDKVNQEREIVLRETADARSIPTFQDNKDFMDALYGEDSPHAYFVLGKEEVVDKATPHDLREFHQRGYSPNNMDLILVGALPENVDELVIRYFSDKSRGPGQKFNFPINPALKRKTILHRHAPEILNHQHPDQSSAGLSIGFVGPTQDAEDSYATSRLTDILGGDANSRLFKKVREEMGLAYGIGSSYLAGNNMGSVNISGSVQSTRANEAIDAIFTEMEHLKNNLVDKEELDRIKRNHIYGLLKYFESNDGHANGIEIKWDKGLTPELHLKKMNAVTPEMVREAARKYFPENRDDGKYVLLLRDPLKT